VDAKQTRRVGCGLLSSLYKLHDFLSLLGFELRGPTAYPAFFACGIEARLGSFLEHSALELGERAYHLHHHPPRGRRGIPRFGETAKASFSLLVSAITLFANRATFDHFTCEWSYHAIRE
jgi:hypothetical protein